MSNKKENNFFTDFDLPFVPPYESDDDESTGFTGIVGKYDDIEDSVELAPESSVKPPQTDDDDATQAFPRVRSEDIKQALSTSKPASLYVSFGDEDRDEAFDDSLQRKLERQQRKEARRAAKLEAGAGAVSDDPYADDEDDEEDDVKKDRTRQSGCMTGVLYFFVVAGVSALLATFIWLCANDVLSLIKPDKTAVIKVEQKVDIADIAKQLEDGGIIEYPWLFKLYCGMSSSTEKIKPGEYTITTELDYHAIVAALRPSSKREIVRVTIPEGWNIIQIFDLLEEKGVCSKADLLEECENGVFDYEFVQNYENVKYRLEGYLFPDTYDFYQNEKAHTVLNRMLSEFKKRFPADYVKWADNMNLTVHQVMTIAAMIEREAANDTERDDISSVIHNRLDSRNFPRLQIDATAVYAWLPKIITEPTAADMEIDDPYNTYICTKLPPGPICSPGMASIRAALVPSDTNYYYYVLDEKEDEHIFCRNSTEFDAALKKVREEREAG